MIVNKINSNIPTKYANPAFKSYLPETLYKFSEKQTIKSELAFRKTAKKFAKLLRLLQEFADKITKKDTKSAKKLTNLFIQEALKTKDSSPVFMWVNSVMTNSLGADREVEINIENNELQNLAASNEASIFIMNHDKQKEDSRLVNFFNTLLTREYILNGKAANCPRPKIILNKDIIDTMDDEMKKLAEKWGAVGVDAAIHSANHIYNGKVLSKLLKEFIDDKVNIFIFPEGRMCGFKHLEPEWKFQKGIADIIRKAVTKKNRVKVVPLGFAYKKNTDAIHIGEPLYFKKDGDRVLFTPGTFDTTANNPKYTEFVETTRAEDSDGFRPILENGKDVNIKNCSEFIAGILCDNLVAGKKQAAESIKNVGSEKDNSTLYVIEDLI